jgi:hypothetical protein
MPSPPRLTVRVRRSCDAGTTDEVLTVAPLVETNANKAMERLWWGLGESEFGESVEFRIRRSVTCLQRLVGVWLQTP